MWIDRGDKKVSLYCSSHFQRKLEKVFALPYSPLPHLSPGLLATHVLAATVGPTWLEF